MAGGAHTAALTDKGHVYMWGRCDSGQLGMDREWLRESDDDGMLGSSRPHRVDGFGSDRVVQVACGAFHSAAVTETGAVYIWGKEDYGMLGIGQSADVQRPQRIEFFDTLPALYVGGFVLRGGGGCSGERELSWLRVCVNTQARVVWWMAHGRGDQVGRVLLVRTGRVRAARARRHAESVQAAASGRAPERGRRAGCVRRLAHALPDQRRRRVQLRTSRVRPTSLRERGTTDSCGVDR